jgi:hypothetical protein
MSCNTYRGEVPFDLIGDYRSHGKEGVVRLIVWRIHLPFTWLYSAEEGGSAILYYDLTVSHKESEECWGTSGIVDELSEYPQDLMAILELFHEAARRFTAFNEEWTTLEPKPHGLGALFEKHFGKDRSTLLHEWPDKR